MSHTAHDHPQTTAAAHQPDTVADPAQDDSEGHDWSSEGGATPDGPATHATPHTGSDRDQRDARDSPDA